MTLQDHIRRYLEVVNRADQAFRSVASGHAELMGCKPGCDDCCSLFFELTLVEAFYVSGMFESQMPASRKETVRSRAADSHRLFEQAQADLAELRSNGREAMIQAASRVRIPCPLKEDGLCLLYEHRPVTCRLYGVPQKVGARVVTCPHAGFLPGRSYSTVDVDEIQRQLQALSHEFLQDLLQMSLSRDVTPRYSLASALRTRFDKGYFLWLGNAVG